MTNRPYTVGVVGVVSFLVGLGVAWVVFNGGGDEPCPDGICPGAPALTASTTEAPTPSTTVPPSSSTTAAPTTTAPTTTTETTTTTTTVPPPTGAASKTDIVFGAAVPGGIGRGADILDRPALQALVANEFSEITAENIMKPLYLHPAPGTFDFTRTDALVQFAELSLIHI